MPESNVIDKKAMFVVKIARNLKDKSPEQRKDALASLHGNTAVLVGRASALLRQNKVGA